LGQSGSEPAGVKQVEPYPTPGDASKRSFPITPLA
jgi:hypothetical protein